MAVKNIYNTKEKEKSIYRASGAANSSRTTDAGAQSTPQNNLWNAAQNTPRSQSSTQQKPKREKSPSELGEEVLALMLREETPKAQQPAAAKAPVAASKTKASAVAAETRSIPRSSVWNAEQNTPRAQGNTLQKRKREKSPSERGEEVLGLMLRKETPKAQQPTANERATVQPLANAKPGESAVLSLANAKPGESAVLSLANAKPGEHAFQSTQWGNRFASPLQRFGEAAGSADAVPAWQTLAAAQGLTNAEANANTQFMQNRQLLEMAPGLTSVEPDTDDFRDAAYGDSTFDPTTDAGQAIDSIYTLPNLSYAGAGASNVQNATDDASVFGTPQSFGEDAGSAPAVPDWLALMSTSYSDYPGLPAAANQIGFGLKELASQFTPDQANSLALDWLDLMSMSNSDYPGLPAAANQIGFGLKEAASQFTPDQANSLALNLLDLMSMSNSDYPGLPMFANPVSPLLKNGAKPLWNDTHTAVDTQAPEIEIQDVESDPQSNRAEPESEALSNEDKSDTVKEWWEIPGASEPIDPNDPAYQALNNLLTDDQREAGLSIVKINGGYYVDVTIMINTRLQEVEQEFRSHAFSALYDQDLMKRNLAWFIAQVSESGPWDIKEAPSWEKQFGDVLNLKNMSETIAYNGQVVTSENLGNLTYGYLGSAMGWPEDVLCFAGGFVNRLGLTWNSIKNLDIWGVLNNGLNIVNPFVYLDGSYGDGENDALFVKKGVELYEAVH